MHALASEALALLRRAGPTGEKSAVRVAAQVEATRDVFREDPAVEIEEWADAELEFVDIQARVAALQDPLRADDRLALARRAVATGLAVGDREMQAWGRLWSMDVHADAALEVARRLGMAPLVDQVEALLGPREGDPLLTPRETDVTALVAEGLSNAAIARRLTLSERTVENHVSRILLKLDLTSRTAWPSGTRDASQG